MPGVEGEQVTTPRASVAPKINRSAGTTTAGDTTVRSGIKISHQMSPDSKHTRFQEHTPPAAQSAATPRTRTVQRIP